jgi:hypothetical protein
MVHVITLEEWLQHGTVVVLGIGQSSSVPCQHFDQQGMVARAASGCPASSRTLLGLACHAGV